MDCTEIINIVTSSSSALTSPTQHDKIPNMEILQLFHNSKKNDNNNDNNKSNQVILLASWLENVCYLQAFLQQQQKEEDEDDDDDDDDSSSSFPIEKSEIELIWSRTKNNNNQDAEDENELISCMKLIENTNYYHNQNHKDKQHEKYYDTDDDEDDDEEDEAEEDNNYITMNTAKVAIILGTTLGNVLSYEVTIEIIKDKFEPFNTYIIFLKNDDINPIEPIPIDLLLKQEQEEMIYMDEDDDDECIIVHPTGCIKQLICYKVENLYPIVWIVYNDGTCIRLAYDRFFTNEQSNDSYHILPPLVTKLDNSNNNNQDDDDDVSIILPLLQSSIPLFRPPGTNIHASYHHITEGICIKNNNSTLDFISSEIIDENDNINNLSSSSSTIYKRTNNSTNDSSVGYTEAVTDGIVSGTKTIVKDMFGSVMGKFGWTSSMISDAVDIAYYRKSANAIGASPSNKHKTIQASNDPFHFLRQEPDIMLSTTTQTQQHNHNDDKNDNKNSGSWIIDNPRKILNVYVHPLGNHIVTTDQLGRVLLLDTSSHQIIRIWKGVRDATCHFITSQSSTTSSSEQQQQRSSKNKKLISYLIIHSKVKDTIEIYRLRHGPRIKLIQNVGNCKVVMSCGFYGSNDCIACYMIQKQIDNFMIRPILLDDDIATINTNNTSTLSSTSYTQVTQSLSSTAPDLQLQLLQQVLSSISSSQIATSTTEQEQQKQTESIIFDTFIQITSINDLMNGLELIMKTKTGSTTNGSMFYIKVLSFVKEKLQEHQQHKSNDDFQGSSNKILLQSIKSKLEYYQRIILAYDIIHGFEIGPKQSSICSLLEDDEVEGSTSTTTLSSSSQSFWAIEAIAWAQTYYYCVRNNKQESQQQQQQQDISSIILNFTPLHFSTFAQACCYTKNKTSSSSSIPFYLSDSTIDRQNIVNHIFRPLLYDIFVYKIVNSIFDTMGIITMKQKRTNTNPQNVKHNIDVLQLYFSEWFIQLPINISIKASFYGSWRPIVRWLQEIIMYLLDYDDPRHIDKYNDSSKYILLDKLYMQCKNQQLLLLPTGQNNNDNNNDGIVKAFILASLCQQAISISTTQKEAKSYGKISSNKVVQPWEDLLRKLRTCLLISLRLTSISNNDKTTILRSSISNLSVSTIENNSNNKKNDDDNPNISIYELLAYDEIMTVAYNNNDLIALEHMLRLNKVIVFSPCTILSDQSIRYKELMDACYCSYSDKDIKDGSVSSSIHSNNGSTSSNNIISDFNVKPGPLLKYFKNFNCSSILASHRVILFGELWCEKPESLDLLKNATTTLKYLNTNDFKNTTATNFSNTTIMALSIDFWQVRLRPIFLTLFYGFDDIDHHNDNSIHPSFNEHVLNPLFVESTWREEFSRISMEVLSLILNTISTNANTLTNDLSFCSLSSQGSTSSISPQKRSGNFRTLFNTNEQDDQAWPPPPLEDPILSDIVSKTKPLLRSISSKSLSIHKSILCSLQLTDDLPLLSRCFPMLSDLFLVHSLFQDVHQNTTPSSCTQDQQKFIHSLLHKKAKRVTQPILHPLEFHNIVTIGQEFSFDQPYILSSFCLIMYNMGKDAFVDELITSNPNMFDMNLLIEGATQIVCERMHQTLSTMKKVRQFRGIIGMVDADLSQWIKEEADKANDGFWKEKQKKQGRSNSDQKGTNATIVPSLSDTHTLVHKLLWLANHSNDPSYKNILLLSKFSSMLLKAVTVQSSNSKKSLFSSLSS